MNEHTKVEHKEGMKSYIYLVGHTPGGSPGKNLPWNGRDISQQTWGVATAGGQRSNERGEVDPWDPDLLLAGDASPGALIPFEVDVGIAANNWELGVGRT